jgi:hypothetical protein
LCSKTLGEKKWKFLVAHFDGTNNNSNNGPEKAPKKDFFGYFQKGKGRENSLRNVLFPH